MAQLQLWFSSSNQPELTRTAFYHTALRARIIAARGKSELPHQVQGSFQWSPAVRAMCILIIKAKYISLCGGKSKFFLQASTRGAVSALDYAIGRSARWILDVFGCNSRGEALARRVFLRGNPERKRPGPITITLNHSFLSPNDIEIYLDGILISKGDELLRIIQSFRSEGDTLAILEEVHTNGTPEQSFSGVNSIVNFAFGFIEEAKTMLSYTDIFSREYVKAACRFISAAPSLGKIKKPLIEAIEKTHIRPAASVRLGLNTPPQEILREIFSAGPLRFGVTPSQIGTLALLRFLQEVEKYPIEIDYSFNHTKDIVDLLTDGDTETDLDFFVITTASSALISPNVAAEFVPLMIMPSASHSILAPRIASSTARKRNLEFQLLDEFPTTPSLWLDSLVASGNLQKAETKRSHADPDEGLRALLSNDPSLRSVLWFPFNMIAKEQFGAFPTYENTHRDSTGTFIQNLLFVKKSLLTSKKTSQLITSLFSNAWLTLLERPELCTQLVRKQVAEEQYGRVILRYSGLNRITNRYEELLTPHRSEISL